MPRILLPRVPLLPSHPHPFGFLPESSSPSGSNTGICSSPGHRHSSLGFLPFLYLCPQTFVYPKTLRHCSHCVISDFPDSCRKRGCEAISAPPCGAEAAMLLALASEYIPRKLFSAAPVSCGTGEPNRFCNFHLILAKSHPLLCCSFLSLLEAEC